MIIIWTTKNAINMFTIGYLIFLIVFALNIHPIEDNHGANPELDFYNAQAASLGKEGKMPSSPYHPALYSSLCSVAGKILGGNYFLGCQIISIISGCIFVYCSFIIAKTLINEHVAWLLLIFVSLNAHILRASVRTASDMLFQSLTMLILLLCIKTNISSEKPIQNAILLGIFFGLAYSTRYNAIFILPVITFFFLSSGKTYPIEFFVALFTSIIIAVTPQLILNYIQFGNPIYNENWRNVAFYYFGLKNLSWNEGFTQYSQEYLFQEFIKNSLYFIEFGLFSIIKFITFNLPNILFGTWELGDWKIGKLFSTLIPQLLTLASFYTILFGIKTQKDNIRKNSLLLVSYVVVMVLSIGFTFPFAPRFVLPIIPFLFMFFINGIYQAVSNNRLLNIMLSMFVIFFLSTQYNEIRSFAKDHVIDDLRAAEWLTDNVCNPSVMGTSLFLRNHFNFSYTYLDSLTVIHDEKRYVDRINSTIRKSMPAYFIVNPISSYGNNTPEFLYKAPNKTLPFLIPVKQVGSSIIFKIDYDLMLKN